MQLDESAHSTSPFCVYTAIAGALDCQGGGGFQVRGGGGPSKECWLGVVSEWASEMGVKLADNGTGLNSLYRHCARGEETEEDVDRGSQERLSKGQDNSKYEAVFKLLASLQERAVELAK